MNSESPPQVVTPPPRPTNVLVRGSPETVSMTLVVDAPIQSRVRELNWAIANLQVMKYVTRHDLRRANYFLANRNVTADYKINGPKVSKNVKNHIL